MQQYFKIGKFVSVRGLEGELILQHQIGTRTALKGLETLFLEDRAGSFLPYFIQQVTAKEVDESWVLLEGIDTREKAMKLARKEVWLEEKDFRKLKGKAGSLSLLGYHIIENKKDLGEVLEVFEQPQQIICRIMVDEKEVLIPLHEGTLQKIDQRTQKIFVELPEGLLDLYLGE